MVYLLSPWCLQAQEVPLVGGDVESLFMPAGIMIEHCRTHDPVGRGSLACDSESDLCLGSMILPSKLKLVPKKAGFGESFSMHPVSSL